MDLRPGRVDPGRRAAQGPERAVEGRREFFRRPAPWEKGEKSGTRFGVLMFGVPVLILGVGALVSLAAGVIRELT